MAFLLRRISTTADGREIVRNAPVDKGELTLGRDAGNDIHLPDLAVNPEHARLISEDGRYLTVEAVSGLGFGWNGSTVTHARIDATEGAELRFGGHRIMVGQDAEGGVPRVLLTIARTDELSHSALERDEQEAFSLHGLLPGRRLSAWAFSVFVLLAFLAAPIWAYFHYKGVEERPRAYHPDMTWTSGPLSSAHASLSQDCQSCHVDAFEPVTDKACRSCHTDVHDHAPVGRQLAARGDPGLWQGTLNRIGQAFGREPGRCVDCHTEHEGAGPMPPTAQRFCTDCHADMNTRLTDTTLGNAGDFGRSHPQFRPLVRVAGGASPRYERVTLGPNTVDFNGLKFPHNIHMQGNGGVTRMARSLGLSAEGTAGLACASCHKPTEDGVRFQPVNMQRDCASCHSLAIESVGGITRTLRHGSPDQVVADLIALYRSTPPKRPLDLGGMARRRPGEFAEGRTYNIYFREAAARPGRADQAIRAVFSPGGACSDCHTIYAPPPGSNRWRVEPVHQTARYMDHGWFDHKPHRQEACTACHAAPTSSTANQLLIPGIAVCRDCHGGENSGAKVESSCASCHAYHQGAAAVPWQPAAARQTRDAPARTPTPRTPARAVTGVTDSGVRRLYGG